nr:RBPJ-interacting and tubulin-associated protein 1-like [Lytechinus pictus]
MSDYSFRNSSDGRQSSLSVQGESMGRDTLNENVKRSYRYRVVSNDSSVDETLFGSHRDRSRKTQGGWSDSPSQRASPSGTRKSPAIKPTLTVSPSMPKTKNKYRIVQHTPTYVDHSLFGGPLEKPSFEAPWTDKKADRRRNTPLIWGSPVQGSLEFESTSNSSMGGERPLSSVGSRPGSATGGRRSSAGSRPQSASGRRSVTPSKPPPWK